MVAVRGGEEYPGQPVRKGQTEKGSGDQQGQSETVRMATETVRQRPGMDP